MCRLLSICVRLCVYGFTLLTCLSLGVASLSTTSAEAPAWKRRWDGLTVHSWSSPTSDADRHFLIDHEGTRAEPLELPEGTHWGPISISPWIDRAGGSEAVAPCHRAASSAGGPFWGLVRLGLPEGRILAEIDLDVLPTGRPCWLPQAPGRVLFAAGDGRLYTHDFREQRDPDGAGVVADPAGPETRPVAWECERPGAGVPYLADPSTTDHPRLQHLLVAAVIPRGRKGPRRANDLTQLWWFLLDPHRNAVTSMGLLYDPNARDPGTGNVIARFPTLVGTGGEVRLAYLARPAGRRVAELQTLAVELDPTSGHPRIAAGASPVVLADDASLTPPVASVDGRSIYYATARGTRPVRQVSMPAAVVDATQDVTLARHR